MYVHHEVGWMYPRHYLAVSGVSIVYIDSKTLVGVYQTSILYFLIVGLYKVLNMGFPYKIIELDPRPIHRWKALVTAELMVILHLNMAYHKGNHLLKRQNGYYGTKKVGLLPKTLI